MDYKVTGSLHQPSCGTMKSCLLVSNKCPDKLLQCPGVHRIAIAPSYLDKPLQTGSAHLHSCTNFPGESQICHSCTWRLPMAQPCQASGNSPGSRSACLQGGGKSPGSQWETSTLRTLALKKVLLLMALLSPWSLLLQNRGGTGDKSMKVTWLGSRLSIYTACSSWPSVPSGPSCCHLDLTEDIINIFACIPRSGFWKRRGQPIRGFL